MLVIPHVYDIIAPDYTIIAPYYISVYLYKSGCVTNTGTCSSIINYYPLLYFGTGTHVGNQLLYGQSVLYVTNRFYFLTSELN